MSKISTYNLADTPLQLSDRLIGTEAPRPQPTSTPLATKNFSLGELLQLFSANFPAATLQAVLDAGNIATQDMFITGEIVATLIRPTNIEDILGSQGTNFQFLSKATTGINWVNLPVDNLQDVLNAGNTATQNINLTGNITSTRIIPGNIQDYTTSIGTTGQVLTKSTSGIVWSNIPTSLTPGLNDVLLVGNTVYSDISIVYPDNGIFSTSYENGSAVFTNTGSGNYVIFGWSGIRYQTSTPSEFTEVGFITPSSNNIIQFPDASGTIALISDIPAAITLTTTGTSGVATLIGNTLNIPNYTTPTPTLQQVTTAGNTTTDAVTLGTTTIKQSTGTNVAIFKDNTNATVGTVNEFGSLNFIGGSHTFGATGGAELIAGTYRTQNYGDGFKDAVNNVNFVASLNTGSIFGWSSKGTIEYAADYSANFGNRTLVDKAYVLSVIPSLTGYVPTSRTLTINGTSYDLTADRSWSVGTVTSVTATSPITSTGGTTPVISTSMSTNKLIGRSTAGTGVMEEITIGTGLTLSGGTLSSTSTSPLTTKGDIYTFSTVNARLGVGLDTQVLIADSTTATGLKWGTNTAATPTGYYAMYQDVLTQTVAVINTGYPIKFRTLDLSNGVTVVSDSRITFANTGIYNLQFSVQLENSDTQEQDVTIWLRKNGVDFPGSAGFVAVVSKHGGVNGHVLPSWNYLLDVVAGDYYELVWSATSTQVTMPFIPAGNPPPSTASALFTVTQQAGIMAGTGITAINSLTGAAQTLATGTTGTDFAINSTGTTHTFNLPTASATNRGALSSADWTTFNGKQNALLDIASVQDNGIYSTFMNGAICYFLAGIGAATFNNLRINSNFNLSGNTANFSFNAVLFSTTATAGTLAWQRGVPFYHLGRSLFRFQPNVVSSDARYFVGLSYLYQLSNPTNVDPTTLTQTIGIAKLSTSTNLFIIHNDGTGTATSVDLGVNYPANSNLYIYDIKITSTGSSSPTGSGGVFTGVTVRRITVSTGATISTDYAVPSNYPTGVGINPALWITNNASAVANSLYYFGAITYNSTI